MELTAALIAAITSGLGAILKSGPLFFLGVLIFLLPSLLILNLPWYVFFVLGLFLIWQTIKK